MYPDVKSYATVSFSLRTLILVCNLLAPYVFYVAISTTGPQSLRGAVYSLFAALVLATVVSYGSTRWKKRKHVYMAAGIGVFLAEGIWLSMESFQYRMIVYLLLIVGFMVRYHLVVESGELSVSVRKALQSDSAFVVATIFVLLFAQSGSISPDYGQINPFVGVVSICTIVLRMVVMWMIHQDVAKSQRRAKAILFLIFASVFVSFALFQKSWTAFLVLTAVVLVIIAIPYFRGLRREYMVIIGLTAVASTLLLLKHVPPPVRRAHPDSNSGSDVVLDPYEYLHKLAMQAHTNPYLFDGLLLLIAIWIGWIVVKRYMREKPSHSDQASVQLVSRGWIRKTGRDRIWIQTDHPVRIRYQKWLQELSKKGWPIKRTETASQYQMRVKDIAAEQISIDSTELTRLYEQARYGEK